MGLAPARRLAAAAVFGGALLATFAPYLRSDLTRHAPASDRGGSPEDEHPWGPLGASDHRYVVWVIARNAWTFLHRPLRLFDAETCFPERQSLALGEPAIALGLLAVPAWLATRDPVATFDLTVLALTALSALAMFLLVREWTGVPAAAITAGLLYAFHPVKLDDVVHPYAWDNAWSVFGILFARRLVERRRWRDAVGLAAACSLQLAGSLYAILGAVCLALPLAAWCIRRYGLRRPLLLQCFLVAALVALAAAALLGPFLERRAEGALMPRSVQFFLAWQSLLPGGPFSPGWLLAGLAALGLLLRSGRFATAEPQPRFALATGALLALLLATGGNQGDADLAEARGEPLRWHLPNPYLALAELVPGLDVVRGPYVIYSGAHLSLAVLAGFGAAALLRGAAPRFRGAAAAAIVALAFVDTLRPQSLGLEPRIAYRMVEIAPPRETIELFDRLRARGDAGPLAEVPLQPANVGRISTSVLLSAYHHRRTVACLGSFLPPSSDEVQEKLARVPEADAVRGLGDLGFTTLVVHHAPGNPFQRHLRVRFEAAAARPGAPIVRLDGNEQATAWAIRRHRGRRGPAPRARRSRRAPAWTDRRAGWRRLFSKRARRACEEGGR